MSATPVSEDLLQIGALYVPDLGWLAQYDNWHDQFYEKNLHLFVQDLRREHTQGISICITSPSSCGMSP